MSGAARPMLWLGLAVLVILGPREKAQTAGYDRGAALPARQLELAERYGKLPLTFEANRGQTDRRVQFLARGNGYALFLTPTEAVMSLRGPSETRRSKGPSSGLDKPMLTSKTAAVLRMTLVGANPKARTMGLEELSGTSNYFIGRDPTQWRTNVPNYGRIRFADVYRGVDLVYYGNQRQLEYDFVVAPGADPSAITLGFAGEQRLDIDAHGELALKTGAGDVRWHKPVVYQEIDGVRQAVKGQYVRKGESSVGFEVASYDPRRDLVIDPSLDYSTYLGGSSSEVGNAIAVDAGGNAYVAGTTMSTDFPVKAGAFQTIGTGYDAFVVKFNSAGFRAYATYLGGAQVDTGAGIAVDALGNAYVTGGTLSLAFPVTSGAYQSAYQGGPGRLDAYVTKLNAAGSGLLYSTYLGGDHDDIPAGIAVDSSNPPNGLVYVTGWTSSTNFPTLNAFLGAGSGNGFVTALNTVLSGVNSLVYSTYIDTDRGRAIAADSSGNVYVTGELSCTDPNPGPQNCGELNTSPFVTKILTTASGISSLIYMRILDARSDQTSVGTGIAIDTVVPPNIYVTGYTNALAFPGTGSSPIQSANHGGYDAFVAKLNGAGNPVYSTYLGGSGDDQSNAIAVDALGNVYVTGQTKSVDFPLAHDLQSSYGGGPLDAFVAKINATGIALVYSTYLGGGGSDWGTGIAADSSGSAYVTGGTSSFNFPVNLFQLSLNGSQDAFVAKIVDDTSTTALPPTIAKAFGANALGLGGTTRLTFSLGNPNSAPLTGVSFNDPLPAGIIVSTPNGLSASTCGGTITAVAGSGSVTLSGGTLAANASCGVSVNVTAHVTGSLRNITGNVTSVEGGAGGAASATLTVQNVAGDFDGDGKPDISIYRPSTGTFWILDSSTNSYFAKAWGSSTDIPVLGDYDGDGKSDVAIFRPSTGTWWILRSSTNYTTWSSLLWGLATDIPVPGDYDGDGKTDVAIFRPSTGTWWILKSSTNNTTWVSQAWGLSTDTPVPGDYDGDGKTDVAIFRPSTGTWWILQSSTNNTTWVSQAWGFSTDTPVPGDYDGDGKTDVAIYRPSTGAWWILQSINNYTTHLALAWGLATDIPVPGDYDGDGKSDVGIFRPSTGTWWMLLSSTNYTTYLSQLWGTGTDVPLPKRP